MTTQTVNSIAPYYRVYDLPWTKIAEESQRLRKIFLSVAGACLFLAVAIPFLPSEPVRSSAEVDVPPRLAKLVIERKTPPPPPVEVVQPKEEVVEAEPEPKPEPEPEPKVEEPKPEPQLAFVPEPEVVPPINEAREKAAKAGLMAMADDLADLRDNSSVDAALSKRDLSNTVGAAERTERSLLTSSAGRASSGINTAGFSRNTGGQGLAGRAVTEVSSPVQSAAQVARQASGGDASAGGQRSRDQIEMTFDRNKAAIYALYRRALRKDPTLQGKLVLELTISPSGEVADVRVLSSELNAPEFEARLIQRVRLFDFGAQDVDTVTTTKPIDFFPV